MAGRLKESDPSLLSKEEGAVKTPWRDRIRIALAYPSQYRTGMSNLGFQTLYALFNSTPSFLCERVFLPDPGDEASFSPGSTPLSSLESGRPLRDFDIVAFSVSFENDYPNILKMLEMGRIPLAAAARGEGDPLVIGGGISLILNPEPLAPFFDLFLLGEAEEMVPEFLERYRVLRAGGVSRDEILAWLQRDIEGAYVPKFYRVGYGPGQRIDSFRPVDATFPTTIRVRHVKDLSAFRTHQVITTPHTEFGDMFLAEVSRGCFRGAGSVLPDSSTGRPASATSAALAPSLEEGLRRKGRVGLLGTAVSDHPQLAEICRQVLGEKGSFSIGSLRIDRISEDLAGLLAASGVEMVSLAPEAGSQRLRDVIRKGISEDQIFRAVEHLIENGIVNLRLYFMVGLPTEEEEDIDAIIDLDPEDRAPCRKDLEGHPALPADHPEREPVHPQARNPLPVAAAGRRGPRAEESPEDQAGIRERALRERHPRPAEVELRPGASLAGRPPRRRDPPGRSRKRRQLAPGPQGGQRQRRLLRLPRKGPRRVSPLGLHRPRREPGVPPGGIPEGHGDGERMEVRKIGS